MKYCQQCPMAHRVVAGGRQDRRTISQDANGEGLVEGRPVGGSVSKDLEHSCGVVHKVIHKLRAG
jgi:hypothetical protein